MVRGVTHLVAHFREEENGVVQCREVGLARRSRPRRCCGGRADNGMGRRVLTPVHGFDSVDLHDENKEAQKGRAGRRRQTTVEAYKPTVDVDRDTPPSRADSRARVHPKRGVRQRPTTAGTTAGGTTAAGGHTGGEDDLTSPDGDSGSEPVGVGEGVGVGERKGKKGARLRANTNNVDGSTPWCLRRWGGGWANEVAGGGGSRPRCE